MKAKYKRRLFPIVNRSHQYRFLSLVVIYASVIAVVIAGSLLIPDFVRLQDPTIGFEARAEAADKILTIHARLWPTLIALICIIGLHSFRIFHRFIGPLYRMTLAFKQIEDGDLGFRLKFRSNDYLKQEEIEFNNMLDSVSNRIKRIHSAGVNATTSITVLEEALAGQPSDDSKNDLNQLRSHMTQLMDVLGQFSLEEKPVPSDDAG